MGRCSDYGVRLERIHFLSRGAEPVVCEMATRLSWLRPTPHMPILPILFDRDSKITLQDRDKINRDHCQIACSTRCWREFARATCTRLFCAVPIHDHLVAIHTLAVLCDTTPRRALVEWVGLVIGTSFGSLK